MDFITDLFLSVIGNKLYNVILVIINQYIKIAFYFFVTKTINIKDFINIIYWHIFL